MTLLGPPVAPPLSPPRPPRLVLRVGITGHRPHGLAEADLATLRSRIRHVLRQLREIVMTAGGASGEDFAPTPPELRLISALAEGADRIAATEALAEGYTLQAPLPFPRERYEHDFPTESSRDEFRSLLARASAVLELDGVREQGSVAYAHVGRVVLSQSDVLIAVWNGEPAVGGGGTTHVAREALSLGVPVLWIDSQAPHELALLGTAADATADQRPLSELPEAVKRLLWPEREPSRGTVHHQEDGGDAGRDPVREIFYRQSAPPKRRVSVYGAFRMLFDRGGTAGTAATVAGDSVAPTQNAVASIEQLSPFTTPAAADSRWADLLADYYGGKYRDTFIGNYLLGALAVAAALVGFVTPAAVLAELGCLVLIIFLTWRGKRNHWHGRWIGYRLLAEQLRMLELLMPIGRVPPSFRAPPYATSANPGQLWVTWFFRARAREIGLATGRLDEPYLERYRQLLRSGIAGQAAYHRGAAERSKQLTHRVHRTTTVIFGMAVVVTLLHLGLDLSHRVSHAHGEVTVGHLFGIESLTAAARTSNALLTALAAALPALAAALAGILSQGEFDRIARRSDAMATALHHLAARLDRPDGAPPLHSEVCAAVAMNAVETMSAELLDWQVTFRAKALELPV